ncbi:MAG: type I-B CRISPR-associated protein Cas7/Csh2 [bacterium]
MSKINYRSEIVFLYDIKDANPNGDPLDENKPRIDEETGINIVTDVRLKRTIRDYLMNFNKEEIFVREIIDDKGKIQDAKLRAKDFLCNVENLEKKGFNDQKDVIKNKIINSCIDVRLFGATIPLDLTIKEGKTSKNVTGSITLTGPVQFKMGRSMHRVEIKHIKGTGAFASKPGTTQKTFREEDILSYSLICFYGIINENAANHTHLTEKDVNLLLEGIWNGTKNLISRSKVGQVPRLLIKVNYKEKNYHIGDLDKRIKISSDKSDEQIRDISELKFDISELVSLFNDNKNKIENIDLKVNERIKIDFDKLKIPVREIKID